MAESSVHPVVYRPASKKEAPAFSSAQHRQRSAAAFAAGAEVYEDVRPGYPGSVVGLLGDAHRVLDVGAGTGKLTRDLLSPGRIVWAIDPSADMVRVLTASLSVSAWRATAEHTGLADNSVDAITCAQTWHWVDTQQAGVEFDRILRPGGRVLLVWNTLDTRDPWILRLSRIMHAGDIQRPGFLPTVPQGWTITEELRTTWTDHLATEQVHTLAHTRSYWLRSGPKIRQRVTDNLNWYLHEHTGLAPGETVALDYRTDAFLLEREREITGRAMLGDHD